MKIRKLLLPLLILALFFSGTLVQAQSKKEKEKEEKIRELEKQLEEALKIREFELQKALEESKRYQEIELRTMLENQKKIQQKAFDSIVVVRPYNKNYYKFFTPGMEFDFDYEPAENLKNLRGNYITSNRERTALSIRKGLEDVTFDTKFNYEVSEGSKGISFKVEGSMDSGTLLIKLNKPDGETIQEIEISPLADISWNQDLRWETDKEKAGNIGSWVIFVKAKNATGRYSVNVRAY